MSAELKTHLLYPVISFLVLAVLFEYGPWDIAFADYLFHLEGDSWSLRNNLVTSSVMHRGGRYLVTLLVIGLLAVILFWSLRRNYTARRAGIYLLASFVITTLTVSGLKQLTHVSCPWDLVRYGGAYPYVPLFSILPPGTPHGECFPAGHASAGYAWVALYYYFCMVAREYRWHGLLIGLVLGLGFDIAQQLRGAHFISHGLWTAAIAWCVATGIYFTLFRTPSRNEQTVGSSPATFAESRIVAGD